MSESYDAILLASFGGPEGPEDVMPFLENVTRGRGVPRERLEEVSHHYLELGGVSPINEQNKELLAALEAELASRGIDVPIYWGNRNWNPFMSEAVQKIHDDGHRKVLGLATSAYSSYSGCRQYREDFAQALIDTDLAGKVRIDKVRVYFDSPGFLEPFADGIVEAISELSATGTDMSGARVFFTTHSIPNAMGESSGPPGMFNTTGGAYEAQHLAAAELVAEMVTERGTRMPEWELTYQSRSGPPHIPWLEPDINDALRTAAQDGTTAAIVVPLGFISDHVEVIWDLDREAAETCEEIGLPMTRVATPGTDPRFVSSLVDLIVERLSGDAAPAISELGPWRVPCAAGCCKNLREDKPHVAGEDSPIPATN
jgi:ferrochelatase